MGQVSSNLGLQAQSKAMFRLHQMLLIGWALLMLIGLFFVLSYLGLLSLDLLIAVPVALAGMVSAVLLFEACAALFAKSAQPVELPTRPKPA